MCSPRQARTWIAGERGRTVLPSMAEPFAAPAQVGGGTLRGVLQGTRGIGAARTPAFRLRGRGDVCHRLRGSRVARRQGRSGSQHRDQPRAPGATAWDWRLSLRIGRSRGSAPRHRLAGCVGVWVGERSCEFVDERLTHDELEFAGFQSSENRAPPVLGRGLVGTRPHPGVRCPTGHRRGARGRACGDYAASPPAE